MLRSIRFFVPVLALGLVAALSQVSLAEDAPAQSSAVISGIVTNEAGEALKNVEVRLEKPVAKSNKKAQPQAAREHRARQRFEKVQSVTTDANGKFTFNNVKPGKYRIVAGNKESGWGHSKLLTVTAGHSQEVRITVKPRTEKK